MWMEWVMWGNSKWHLVLKKGRAEPVDSLWSVALHDRMREVYWRWVELERWEDASCLIVKWWNWYNRQRKNHK